MYFENRVFQHNRPPTADPACSSGQSAWTWRSGRSTTASRSRSPGPTCTFRSGWTRSTNYQQHHGRETRRYKHRVPYTEWVQTRDGNEAIDCEVYAYAAAIRAGMGRFERAVRPRTSVRGTRTNQARRERAFFRPPPAAWPSRWLRNQLLSEGDAHRRAHRLHRLHRCPGFLHRTGGMGQAGYR